jgi:hypothetical protein
MTEAKQRILCIIPAYNEEEAVVQVVRELREHLPQADVLVVDDGSFDRTAERARAAGAVVCSLAFNLGIGAAVQTGLKYAARSGYDIAIQVDGDGQHPAEEIPPLLEVLEKNPEVDVVIGSRFLGRPGQEGFQSTGTRRIGIRIFAAALSAICRQKLTDTTSGFRATRGEAIGYLGRFYPRDYPEVEALVLLHQARYVVRETPVVMRERQGGASSIRLGHGLYYMIKVFMAVALDLLKETKGRKGDPTTFPRRALD